MHGGGGGMGGGYDGGLGGPMGVGMGGGGAGPMGAMRGGYNAYAHDSEDAIAEQDYLGVEREYYRPVERGFEAELKQRLETIRARLRAARSKPSDDDA